MTAATFTPECEVETGAEFNPTDYFNHLRANGLCARCMGETTQEVCAKCEAEMDALYPSWTPAEVLEADAEWFAENVF